MSDAASFPRAPIPSAPAKSAITKLQVALNNLSTQVCEAIYVVAEAAPTMPFSEQSTKEEESNNERLTQQSQANYEIVRRSQQIAVVVRAIEELIEELPDTARTEEDAYIEIDELLKLNAEMTNKLFELTSISERLKKEIIESMMQLVEEVREEEGQATIW